MVRSQSESTEYVPVPGSYPFVLVLASKSTLATNFSLVGAYDVDGKANNGILFTNSSTSCRSKVISSSGLFKSAWWKLRIPSVPNKSRFGLHMLETECGNQNNWSCSKLYPIASDIYLFILSSRFNLDFFNLNILRHFLTHQSHIIDYTPNHNWSLNYVSWIWYNIIYSVSSLDC